MKKAIIFVLPLLMSACSWLAKEVVKEEPIIQKDIQTIETQVLDDAKASLEETK